MEVLVFIHGFLGGAAVWEDQVAVFSDSFRVIAPDLPGYGQRCDQEAPERIEHFAAHVLDTLTGLDVSRFHLVGHSMGGMVVQEMAARAPERIGKLVLYGTGPVGELPGRFEPIAESKRRAVAEGADITARRITASWFLDFERAPRFGPCADLAAGASLQAVLAGLSAMESWNGKQALPRLAMPTLVIWGDQDRTYPWSQPESLWRGIANSELAVIPGCAHNVHLEKPDLFNAVLADFLGRPSASPSPDKVRISRT